MKAIHKARTRFTNKLFLTLHPVENKTKDNYLLNLAKARLSPNNQISLMDKEAPAPSGGIINQ